MTAQSGHKEQILVETWTEESTNFLMEMMNSSVWYKVYEGEGCWFSGWSNDQVHNSHGDDLTANMHLWESAFQRLPGSSGKRWSEGKGGIHRDSIVKGTRYWDGIRQVLGYLKWGA